MKFPNKFEEVLYNLKRLPLQRWWHCTSYNESPPEWGFVLNNKVYTFDNDSEGRYLWAVYHFLQEKGRAPLLGYGILEEE